MQPLVHADNSTNVMIITDVTIRFDMQTTAIFFILNTIYNTLLMFHRQADRQTFRRAGGRARERTHAPTKVHTRTMVICIFVNVSFCFFLMGRVILHLVAHNLHNVKILIVMLMKQHRACIKNHIWFKI